MQLENIFDLWSVFQDKGLESAAFSFFQQLPLGTILVFVFLVVIVISFCHHGRFHDLGGVDYEHQRLPT